MSYITYDPDEPGGREKAYFNSILGFIVFMSAIGGAFYYVFSLIDLFHGKWSPDVLYAFGLLSVVAIVVFFVLFAKLDKELRREWAKKYFLFFWGGLFDISGIIGIIVSLHSLATSGTGIFLLIASLVCVILITVVIVLIYRKIEGYEPVKLFADKDVVSEISREFAPRTPIFKAQSTNGRQESKWDIDLEKNYIYCHKCGKRLPDDSGFCNSCGTKLK